MGWLICVLCAAEDPSKEALISKVRCGYFHTYALEFIGEDVCCHPLSPMVSAIKNSPLRQPCVDSYLNSRERKLQININIPSL